ncbi:TetR/AcrR family transcriptional regulator C-terminal domain-containing protein [Streptomyces sp. DSM 40750]|uniref:TetR/AcrR family transcriptional regulator C-terminal domain-containing protein n=1 Tax=Streptomyces sp. DSM 40750 TaxID=2801030 RepID=UPI0027D463DF|nr:TetR/AcrR family transcriptional regulator C-terminal domain-containing protein [Streptomyces sp. DSM 40750]
MTTSEAAWLVMLARGGQSPEDWTRQLASAIERATGDYPHLGRRYAAQAGAESADIAQDNFDHGLQWVLDGLATRL